METCSGSVPPEQALQHIRFKIETVSPIRDSICLGNRATSPDLTDAYFHVLIYKRDNKWFRFVWQGKMFQFRALPFGLSLAS